MVAVRPAAPLVPAHALPKPAPKERDVHDLPDLSSSRSHREPILYLPPRLSSLPLPSPPVDPTSEHLYTPVRLPTLDPASLSLHKALHQFRPVTEAYASTPYPEAFNWDQLELDEDVEREWYIVAFRSERRIGSDGEGLYEADRLAHEEAIRNGGLVMYWYGVPNDKAQNLATCIWQSRAQARRANSGPDHIKAVRLAGQAYEHYDLERYVLRKVKGERGVHVEEFTGGEVGWA